MIQNVRGKLFDANGVWGVATAPAARRNGYCRQAMAALLAAGRAEARSFRPSIRSASRSTSGWVT